MMETEERAMGILGKGRVVTAEEAAQKWGEPSDVKIVRPTWDQPLAVFPSKEILVQCAKENRTGNADWRLTDVSGLSFWEQRDIRGVNTGYQPCFNERSLRLRMESEDSWTTQRIESGYRLLNFNPCFFDMFWEDQTDAIANLGACYERAQEQAVAEALFSLKSLQAAKIHVYFLPCSFAF